MDTLVGVNRVVTSYWSLNQYMSLKLQNQPLIFFSPLFYYEYFQTYRVKFYSEYPNIIQSPYLIFYYAYLIIYLSMYLSIHPSISLIIVLEFKTISYTPFYPLQQGVSTLAQLTFWVILCCRGAVLCVRIFSSISALYPLDVNSTLLPPPIFGH